MTDSDYMAGMQRDDESVGNADLIAAYEGGIEELRTAVAGMTAEPLPVGAAGHRQVLARDPESLVPAEERGKPADFGRLDPSLLRNRLRNRAAHQAREQADAEGADGDGRHDQLLPAARP